MNTFLAGVPAEAQDQLRSALESARPEERLAVCLYFQRDLPASMQTLARIEEDLRSIFPTRRGSRLSCPDDYADFQASAVRFVLNNDKRSNRNGQRLFESPARGTWRNTNAGNAVAEAVLARAGIAQGRPGTAERTVLAGEEPLHEWQVELSDFVSNAEAFVATAAGENRFIILTRNGNELAEVHPVVNRPNPALAGSLLWEADDAYAPDPQLWESAR